MSISTGSICSNRPIRVAVPISGAAVATVAPRAVAARIADGDVRVIWRHGHDRSASGDSHTGERGGRRGDRVPQLAASHALGWAVGVQGDQRRGFVVEVRQAAQQGFGVVQPQVGEEARRLNVVADEHRVRAARPGQLGPVK